VQNYVSYTFIQLKVLSVCLYQHYHKHMNARTAMMSIGNRNFLSPANVLLSFFEVEVLAMLPRVTSNFWVWVILLPQPPKYLRLQACATATRSPCNFVQPPSYLQFISLSVTVLYILQIYVLCSMVCKLRSGCNRRDFRSSLSLMYWWLQIIFTPLLTSNSACCW
jgi:hypothetical protein